jgi:aminocarboxymuconate-semialdehyde decarboxylase
MAPEQDQEGSCSNSPARKETDLTSHSTSPDRATPQFHRCDASDHTRPYGDRPAKRSPYRTIDTHCHLFVPAVEALVAGHSEKIAEGQAARAALGEPSMAVNEAMYQTLAAKLTETDLRLRDMDAVGVDVQAISPSPIQYYYWAEPELSEKVVALQNEAIATLCSRHPTRFIGMGTVSMQQPHRAAEQLKELIQERGFKGVQISTLVNGVDVADPAFERFWSMAEQLSAVVFVHPWGSTLGSRLADQYLFNVIGQPFETTVCLSKLILGGHFDRLPALKILAAHGGGYLPLYIGRTDRAHAIRPETNGCACQPSEYLKRIWYDSIVYDPASLKMLVDRVGRQQVVLGTDYPYDMGHYDSDGLLAGFDEQTQRMILGTNAETLFGLRGANMIEAA